MDLESRVVKWLDRTRLRIAEIGTALSCFYKRVQTVTLPRGRGVGENHAVAPARLGKRNRKAVGAAFLKLRNLAIL